MHPGTLTIFIFLEIYTYTSFGKVIQSEFKLNSFLVSEKDVKPDFVVRKIKKGEPTAVKSTDAVFQQGQDNGNLFYIIRNTASFFLKEKKYIEIEQFHEDDDLIECILIEKVFPFFLQNIGIKIFKGSILTFNGKAHVLFGLPGVGLSTILAYLNKKNCPIMADGWFRIIIEKNKILAVPTNTNIKLWSNSIDELDLRGKVVGKVRQKLPKYYVTHANSIEGQLLDLMSFNQIIIEGAGKYELSAKETTTVEALEILSRHFNPNFMAYEKANEKERFEDLMVLGSEINLKQFMRPKALFNIKEHAEFILNHLNE